ncbi:MAG: tetratricopeptide repeat protein [bacterium]|nr:tetratricopeptide repeat protein [bacterium]
MKSSTYKILLSLTLPLLVISGCATHSPFNSSLQGSSRQSYAANSRASYHYLSSETRLLEGDLKGAITELEVAIKYDAADPFLFTRLASLYLRQGDIRSAIKTAKDAVFLEPDNINAHKILAALYSSSNMAKEAILEYEKLVSLKPEEQEPYLFLGMLYSSLGEHDKAIKNLKQLLDIEADSLMAFYYLGRVYTDMKQYPKALDSYNKALALKPGFRGALFDLAMLHEMRSNNDEAISAYKKLLSIYPQDQEARNRLGNLLLKINRLDEALLQFEEMKTGEVSEAAVRMKIGLIYLEQQKTEKAAQEFNAALDLLPGNDMATYYLGIANMNGGEADLAIENFLKVPLSSDYHTDAIINAGHILKEAGRGKEAIILLEGALKTAPKDMALYMLLVSLYSDSGRYDKAKELLFSILNEKSTNNEARFRLGLIYEKTGDMNSSIMEMRKILEIDPEHADAMNYIGYAYAEKETNLNEAEQLATKALKLKPESGYIADTLGWIYYKKGKIKEAIKTLKIATELSPDDPVIIDHLGDAYMKDGRKKAAKEMYLKAVELQEEEKEKAKLIKKINDL